MDLYILRHGEAIKKIGLGINDYNRPLTISGTKDITTVGKFLKNHKISLDHVFFSPLTRCSQTANIIKSSLNIKDKKKFVELNDLIPEGNVKNVCNIISKLNLQSTILIIGHNPYLTKLILSIISEINHSEFMKIRLKTSGLVKIRITTFSPKISGELRWLLTPRVMSF